jgi:hypothetical protein
MQAKGISKGLGHGLSDLKPALLGFDWSVNTRVNVILNPNPESKLPR